MRSMSIRKALSAAAWLFGLPVSRVSSQCENEGAARSARAFSYQGIYACNDNRICMIRTVCVAWSLVRIFEVTVGNCARISDRHALPSQQIALLNEHFCSKELLCSKYHDFRDLGFA